MIIEGKNGKYEIVIGLEVHAQVKANTKLFSSAPTGFDSEPNHNVALFDIALPGMLPVINKHAIHQAVKTGLAIKAKINKKSHFDRKNYFYADLPQGYQISQFYTPIVGEGEVTIDLDNGSKTVRIERIHLEQDAGKSIHDQHPTKSYIDFNRSGVALMEIVSKPDMRSPEEAAAYVKALREILRSVDSCDGDMEKGSFRCDANVSVRPVGDQKLGTRCEIKNLNSIKSLLHAIEYEAKLHVEKTETGIEIKQETKLFNPDTGETRSMRSKENANDYRYFPEPDLPALIVSDEVIAKAKSELPELPRDKRERYKEKFGLSHYDAEVLTGDAYTAVFFEELVKKHDAKLACNWLCVELFGRLNKEGQALHESKVTASSLSELLGLIANNTISGKIAKEVLDDMFVSGNSPASIVESKGLVQIVDASVIEKMIDEVLSQSTTQLESYKAGNQKLFGYFVGQAMKASGGKINPAMLNEILKKKLDEQVK